MPSYVESEIKWTGLELENTLRMPGKWDDIPVDDAWLRIRQEFYSRKPIQDGPMRGWGVPFISVAHKPEVLETMASEVKMITDFYKDREERTDSGIRDITFHFPVLDDELELL